MDKSLPQKAIDQALRADWEGALTTNLEILKTLPDDIDSLNRLGRIYFEIGRFAAAKKTAQRVLKIDRFNKIALRFLNRLKSNIQNCNHDCQQTATEVFIEEPGKTKLVELTNIGTPAGLAQIDCGDEVIFNPQGHRLLILTIHGDKIGSLPDKIGARLKKLIKDGCSFRFFVKSVDTNKVTVFIRSAKPTFSLQTADQELLSDQN